MYDAVRYVYTWYYGTVEDQMERELIEIKTEVHEMSLVIKELKNMIESRKTGSDVVPVNRTSASGEHE